MAGLETLLTITELAAFIVACGMVARVVLRRIEASWEPATAEGRSRTQVLGQERHRLGPYR